MKTIVEALKDLYVALGGKEQDVANLLLNPDVIEKIAAVAGDAVKPELPSLTGNAGKFLKVDSDAEGVEWAEAGGGGGEPLIINISETMGGFVMDKTYSQIRTAFLSSGAIGFQYGNTYGAVVYICDGNVEGEIPISVSVFVYGDDGPQLQHYVANTAADYPYCETMG